MTSQENGVRETMNHFWQAHSKNADLNEMMLDSNAEKLNQYEMNEILTMIPQFNGKSILELGAGIGRYTTEFCKKSKNVVAVDFMESFVEKNREINKNFDNLKLICADVMNLNFDDQSFDIIFTNWLFMYLTDGDIKLLTSRMLKWLKPGGQLFVRESCNRPSGNIKLTDKNPTLYRTAAHYNSLLTSSLYSNLQFGIVWSKPIETYIKFKNNKNQICWLLQAKEEESRQMQQITKKQIEEFQRIYGENCLDVGAVIVNNKMSSFVDLKNSDVILDIGCGIGGNSFFIAKEFGCDVIGIDSSSELIDIAEQLNDEHKNKIKFQLGDVRNVDFAPNSYDVIYSRDALVYNREKKEILMRTLNWLKTGGKFVLIDYCCSADTMATDAEEGFLISIPQYEQLLADSGFGNVSSLEITNDFIESSQNKLETFRWEKSNKFQWEEKKKIEEKIEKMKSGQIQWVVFTGTK